MRDLSRYLIPTELLSTRSTRGLYLHPCNTHTFAIDNHSVVHVIHTYTFVFAVRTLIDIGN